MKIRKTSKTLFNSFDKSVSTFSRLESAVKELINPLLYLFLRTCEHMGENGGTLYFEPKLVSTKTFCPGVENFKSFQLKLRKMLT